MGFNEFIGKLFGNKATRDMKEIKPWVDKVKAIYPEISKLSNDELRARTGPRGEDRLQGIGVRPAPGVRPVQRDGCAG